MKSRSRRSIRYYTDDLPEEFGDFYLNMFIEDVADGLMPIGGEARERNFSVRVEPTDERLEGMLITGLVTHDTQDSLAAAVSELFRLVAHEVCARDYAAYEIVYKDDEDGKVAGFDLAYITAKEITVRRKYIRQGLPRDLAQERGLPVSIRLNRSDVVLFHAPRELQRMIRRARHLLSRLRDDALASLSIQSRETGLPYDFQAHQSTLNIALADALKEIGWTARGLFNERILSFYLVYMHLLFEKFKLCLREGFLNQLNEGLSRIGKIIQSNSHIDMNGLPTTQEIDVAFDQLRDGTKPFTEIMQPFLRY